MRVPPTTTNRSRQLPPLAARALALWLAVVAPLPSPVAAQQPRCSYGPWSAPAPVEQHVLRFPSIATLRAQTYAVGNSITTFGGMLGGDTLFTAVDLSGRSIGRPQGRHVILIPMIATLSDSSLMMLWGEPDTLTERREFEWPARLTQVWSATWHVQRGWSDPQLLFKQKGLLWRVGQMTEPVRSSDGALHVALPAVTGVRYLRYQNGEWRIIAIPYPNGPGYASAVTDPSGRTILIAYVSSDPDVPGDVNSLFIVRSTDAGLTWSRPAIVSASRGGVAYEVHLRAGDGRRVQLAWMRDQDDDDVADVVRIVTSDDWGGTWSAPHDARLAEGGRAIRSAIDRCGTLHVVYEDWHGGGLRGHVDYLRFNGRAWSSVQHLGAERIAMSPTLGTDRAGRILLLFLSRDGSEVPTEPLRTWYSRLPLGVGRSPD